MIDGDIDTVLIACTAILNVNNGHEWGNAFGFHNSSFALLGTVDSCYVTTFDKGKVGSTHFLVVIRLEKRNGKNA